MVRLIEVRATKAALAGLDIPPDRGQGEYAKVSVDPERCMTPLGRWLAENVPSTRSETEPRLTVQLHATRAQRAFDAFAVETQERRLRDRAEAAIVFADLDAFGAAHAERVECAGNIWFARATEAFEWPVLGAPAGATNIAVSAPPRYAPTLEEELLRGELTYLCEMPQTQLKESTEVCSYLRTYAQGRLHAHEDGSNSWFEPAAIVSSRSCVTRSKRGPVPVTPAEYFDYCAQLIDWALLAEQVWLEGTDLRVPDDLLMMKQRARRMAAAASKLRTEPLLY